MALPAFGIVSDLISTHARKNIFGYRMMVWAILVIGGLSFVVWAHHMYVSGMNPYFGFFFATTTLIIAVPTAIKVYNWVLTLWRGNIHLNVPMLFAIAFIFTFVNGGLTGLFLGNVMVDLPLSDTMFVVAHFHMVMGIAPMLVVFGAIYHWYPKVTGRMLDDTLGKIHFWITFVGTYAIFYPMHYLGFMGMPRRYYAIGGTNFIPDSAHLLNAWITIAAFVVGAAQLVFLYNLVASYFRGKPAGPNPWHATTLEWQTRAHAAQARQFRQGAAGGLSLGLRLRRAGPQDRLHPAERAACARFRPKPGPRPRGRQEGSGMTIGLVFLTLHDGRHRVVAVPPDDQRAAVAGAGRGDDVHTRPLARPAVKTALWVFLGVATSLFALFISAYAMRMGFADWTPLPRPRLLMLNTALLVGASLAMEWTVYAARRADGGNVRRGLWASGLLTFGFLAGQLFVWQQLSDAGYFVSTSAATAFFYLLTAVHGLHVLGGLVAWVRASARAWRGADPAKVQARRRAVRDLLALPARRLGGAVRAARVGRRRAGDLHVGATVTASRDQPMTTHEATGTTARCPRPTAGKASSRTCPRISGPSRTSRGASR